VCNENGQPIACTVASAAANWPVSLNLVFGLQGLTSDQDLSMMNGAAKSFINQLNFGDRISIMHLEDAARLQLPFTTDKNQALGVLDLLHPVPGGNALYDAVVFSAGSTQRETGRRQIVVLITTDNNLSGSVSDFNQALSTARASGVTYYTIAIGPKLADVNLGAFLRQLARDTGGQFFSEPSSLNYASLLNRLTQIIQSQLVVTYYANPPVARTTDVGLTFRIPGGSVTAARSYSACLP
jgi:hypothetical protein